MRPLALTLFALLLIAVPAQAKEISAISVCGSEDCVNLDSKHDGNLMAFANGGSPTDPPGTAAPFYRLRFTVREPGTDAHDSWTVQFVPKLRLIGSHGEGDQWVWSEVAGPQARRLNGAARGLAPISAAHLKGFDQKPPGAQVVEVLAPPKQRASTEDDGVAWGWIAAAAGAALLAAAAALMVVRSRSRTTRTSARPA
jgi:hypothetical protein